VILTTYILPVPKTLTVGMPGKGICSALFLDTVLMVPSLEFTAAAGGEHLSCDGFSHSETVLFWILKLIADHFGGLSLFPLGNGSGTTAMGPACGRPPLPQQIMVGNPTEWLTMAPSGEGRTNLPFLGRNNMKASLTSTTTTPWPESPPVDQATVTILPWYEMPRSDNNLPLERWRTCWEASQRQIELASGHATMKDNPCKPLQCMHLAEERILMIDCAATKA
jgi:hypothetical protein